MTNRQTAKLNMYRAAEQTLINNQPIIAASVAFTNILNAFAAKIAAIISLGTLEKEVITGVTEDKKGQKDNLAETAASMAALIYAFASANNNDILKAEVSVSEVDLKKLKDNMLPLKVNNIIKAAQDNLKDLADYGITKAMIAALQTILDNYSEAVPKPKSARSSRSSQVKSLSKLFKETDDLLKNEIDKLVISYKSSAPDFVNAFKSARVIIDPSRRKAKSKKDTAVVA